MSMNEIVKTMQDAVNRQTEQAKPGGYDTTATVRRIEGGTAWVHIPGGVDETPVSLTIDAKPGDNVQVRVSGGRAFLVGNGSAPPTDDTTAIHARTIASTAQKTAKTAQAVAESVEGIAVNASANANTAITLAEGVNDHFWSDSAGAHITEDTQEDYLDDPSAAGGNTLITSQGMAVRHGTDQLASFTASGAQIGKDDENRLIVTPIELLQKNADGAVFFNVNTNNGTKTISVTLNGGSGSKSQSIASSKSTTAVSEVSIPSDLESGTTVTLSSVTGKIKPQYTGSEMVGWSLVFSNDTFSSTYREPSGFVTSNTLACFDVPSTNISIGTNYTHSYACDLTVNYSGSAIGIYHVECAVSYIASENKCSSVWTITNNYSSSRSISVSWSALQADFSYSTTVPYYILGTSADAAVGAFSIVGGQSVYATSDNQSAFGKFNVQDSNNDYAFMIGNGSDSANRSNALTVDWSGNVEAAGDITDGSSNVLSNKADKTDVKNISVVSKSGSTGSISAGSYKNLSLTPTAPTGKSLVGCVGVHMEGTNSSYCQLIGYYVNGTDVHVQMKNTSSGSVTWTCTVDALYV